MEQTKKKNRKLLTTIGIEAEIINFIDSLSMLANSGMAITTAIQAIHDDSKSKRMRKVLSWILEDLENGASVADALSSTELFDDHTISLISLGEQSGKLVQNLQVVAVEQEKQKLAKSRLRSAMMYPIFVMIITMVVGISLAWFILPKLATVFEQLDLDLPAATKFLISTGLILEQYGVIIVPSGIFVLMLIFYLLFAYKKTKRVGQSLLFAIPGVNRLIMQIEIARLGYLMGSLLDAGLPVTSSLKSLSDSTEFVYYRRLYAQMAQAIEDGISLKDSFATYKKAEKLVPKPIQQLIAAGEQAGDLPEIFQKIGNSFQAKSEASTKNLTTILEPILLVVVWLGVVGVALAVILPIYNLIGGFNA